jgi:leucyl aminopeptidase (aminopeptidase T)
MAFDLEKLFVDVFAPQKGDTLTIMYDVPHGKIQDNSEWQDRRRMADEWHAQIAAFAKKYGLVVNPIATYNATGSHNSNMPEYGMWRNQQTSMGDILKHSTIVIAMPEYSVTAPLMCLSKKHVNLRAASMPNVARSMERTGLAADYRRVAALCAQLAPLFRQADSIEVQFSTGHGCHFDISNHGPVFVDDAILHPGMGPDADRVKNLPSGEVCTCPNESKDSRTAGEIPVFCDGEVIVLFVEANRIIDVKGGGLIADQKRQEFASEPALRNIAEVAIGCNESAAVTGNVLEDEKAGFHWAFGRSDFLGGSVGVADFSSPEKVCHEDIVYAKGNPIVCKKLDFVFSNGTRKTAITNGVLSI